MNRLDCPHLIDAGAWVLGALPGDEATDYAMHLRGCDACSEEVARLQTVADVLPMAAEQVEPPPALRSAVLDVVRAEAARASKQGKGAERSAGRRWSPRRIAAVAAAGLAVGVVGGVLVRGGDDAPRPRTVELAFAPEGARGALVVEDGHARLHVSGMPAPPDGKIYQVWKQRPGHKPDPTDALFTVSRGGSATVDVPEGVEGVEQVLVTAEPRGGSRAPTSEPVLGAQPA